MDIFSSQQNVLLAQWNEDDRPPMSLECSLSRVLCTLTRQIPILFVRISKNCRLVRNTKPMTTVTTSRSGGGKVFGFVVSFGLLLSLLLLSLVAGMQSWWWWWWWWWCVSLSSSSSSSLPPSSCCYYVVLLFPLCCCCCWHAVVVFFFVVIVIATDLVQRTKAEITALCVGSSQSDGKVQNCWIVVCGEEESTQQRH